MFDEAGEITRYFIGTKEDIGTCPIPFGPLGKLVDDAVCRPTFNLKTNWRHTPKFPGCTDGHLFQFFLEDGDQIYDPIKRQVIYTCQPKDAVTLEKETAIMLNRTKQAFPALGL